MPTLKFKAIQNMSREEKEKKLKELKMELVKANSKGSRSREIRKIIARMLTLKAKEEKSSGVENNK